MYKPAVLKSSVLFYSEPTKQGFNLDLWLHGELILLGIIPSNTACCKHHNLHLKQGFVFRGNVMPAASFNFNKELKKVLARLTVTIPNLVCCPAKDVSIQSSYVFYSKDSLSGTSFIAWVKSRLSFYGISFTDPCC